MKKVISKNLYSPLSTVNTYPPITLPTKVDSYKSPKVHRNDIYYIKSYRDNESVGSEQRAGRPAMIVSNEENNRNAETLEIVYLTLKDKTDLPTHTIINEGKCKGSTVLGEQITTVSVERLGDYADTLQDPDIQFKIDMSLMVSLSLMKYASKEVQDKYYGNATASACIAIAPPDYLKEIEYLRTYTKSLEVQLEDVGLKLKEAEKFEDRYDSLINKLLGIK